MPNSVLEVCTDLEPIDWMAHDTTHQNNQVEHHKCLQSKYGAISGGDHQEISRSFNNDATTSKNETLCKNGAQGLPYETVMELEINSQNISQEGSQQTLQRNGCPKEHFPKNQSYYNPCKECHKLVNEQPCENPHNITRELHLSEYLPRYTHYENIHSPDFDNDLHDFQNHISFLEKCKSNVYSEPKDIEEIISVFSDDIHVSSTGPQPISNDGSKGLAVSDNQSKKIPTYTCQPEVHQLAPSVTADTSGSKDNEFLISALHLPKRCCEACGKKVIGQVLIALGKMWHLDHFTCHQCGIQLGTNIFYEAEGRAYCENDYINTFSPKCATCDEPILEKCISALNKLWHPHHFLCCYCNQRCDEEGYHEINGLAYCSQDFYNIFAPKCFGCGGAIIEGYITALNHQWHVTCFVCFECKEPFTSGSFYDHGGQPFCEQHFNVLKKGFCVSCNQMIIGPSITALGKKYHPGHFTCTFCLQIIYKGTFREHENKPYCHQCSDRLFS